MMRDFIKCIIEDTPVPIDVETGIRIYLPGIIANESAKRGGELLEIPQIFLKNTKSDGTTVALLL